MLNKKSKVNTYILILIIFFATFLSDTYLLNSQLTIPLILSSLLSGVITFLAIPKLKEFKIKQTIRKEGPQKHLAKSGTPTLGGILMVPAGIIIGILVNINNSEIGQVLAVGCITLLFMIIGFIDDYLSIIKNQNMGLKAGSKLLLQMSSAIVFIFWLGLNNWMPTSINLWSNYSININYLIWPFAVFVLIAESNSTNLTDGLDGLAAGSAALIFTGMALHLNFDNNDISLALSRFSISMAGTSIGFLLLNKNPAKIFMGDSGSLAIGASLAGVALISNNLWPLLIMGGIFLVESLSVILQVSTFKISKRLRGEGARIFLMTPIHHHFELKGYKETIIVKNFWIITLILIILSFIV